MSNINTNSNTNTNVWKDKGKTAMERISATGILNKNYPDRDPDTSYSKESQAALNILNAKYPKTTTNKGGKKSKRSKSKRRKSKRKSSKRSRSRSRKY